MVPTVCVPSTTKAAPTARARAPIRTRSNSVPSVQCACSIATNAVSASIAATTASFHSAARLAPGRDADQGASGAATARSWTPSPRQSRQG